MPLQGIIRRRLHSKGTSDGDGSITPGATAGGRRATSAQEIKGAGSGRKSRGGGQLSKGAKLRSGVKGNTEWAGPAESRAGQRMRRGGVRAGLPERPLGWRSRPAASDVLDGPQLAGVAHPASAGPPTAGVRRGVEAGEGARACPAEGASGARGTRTGRARRGPGPARGRVRAESGQGHLRGASRPAASDDSIRRQLAGAALSASAVLPIGNGGRGGSRAGDGQGPGVGPPKGGRGAGDDCVLAGEEQVGAGKREEEEGTLYGVL